MYKDHSVNNRYRIYSHRLKKKVVELLNTTAVFNPLNWNELKFVLKQVDWNDLTDH